MAKLTFSDVKHVADLAKLELTNNEIKKFQKQLSSIVNYVSELKEVDTTNVTAISQTTGLTNVTSVDKSDVTSCLSQEEALSGTEKVHNNFFKVPVILEK